MNTFIKIFSFRVFTFPKRHIYLRISVGNLGVGLEQQIENVHDFIYTDLMSCSLQRNDYDGIPNIKKNKIK